MKALLTLTKKTYAKPSRHTDVNGVSFYTGWVRKKHWNSLERSLTTRDEQILKQISWEIISDAVYDDERKVRRQSRHETTFLYLRRVFHKVFSVVEFSLFGFPQISAFFRSARKIVFFHEKKIQLLHFIICCWLFVQRKLNFNCQLHQSEPRKECKGQLKFNLQWRFVAVDLLWFIFWFVEHFKCHFLCI